MILRAYILPRNMQLCANKNSIYHNTIARITNVNCTRTISISPSGRGEKSGSTRLLISAEVKLQPLLEVRQAQAQALIFLFTDILIS